MKGVGNWLNSPYFGGNQTERFCAKSSGMAMTVDEFVSAAQRAQLDPAQLQELAPGYAGSNPRVARKRILASECDVVRAAAPGERNNTLNKAAFKVGVAGVAPEDARDALVEAALECGLPREEAEDTVARALCDGANAAGEFEAHRRGGVERDNQHNIRAAIRQLGATLRYDKFGNRPLVEGLADVGPLLDDRAIERLWLLVDERFGFRPTKDFFWTVVSDAARRNGFHPILDYLGSLRWDGVPRLDNWLHGYGGAEDTRYVRAVGGLLLTAAVRRVREPGCKFDEMVVLESPQGTKKSSALALLAVREEWFSDDLPLHADTKRRIEALQGHWIVEVAELQGMRRSDVDELKAALSRRKDRARMSYDRTVTEIPRQCIIVGTTNAHQYLKDDTGNRRFWPVRVAGFDLAALAQDRDQLWAEAVVREARGDPIRLDPALWAAAAEQQEQRLIEDPYLNALAPTLGERTGKIKSADVFAILQLLPGHRTQEQNRRVGQAMAKLGWTRTKLRFKGPPEWCYVRGDGRDTLHVDPEIGTVQAARPEPTPKLQLI